MSYQHYLQWKLTTNIGTPYLSVIVPTYNDETRIVPTIGAIASYIANLGFAWELIIVDDNSTDETVAAVENLDLANVRVIRMPEQCGKNAAVQCAMADARGTYVLLTDAGHATPIEELEKLLSKLENEPFDLVVGSRTIAIRGNSRSLLQRWGRRGIHKLIRRVFDFEVRDAFCGFRLFTQEVGQALYAQHICTDHFSDLEIVYLATRLGYRIAEVPVTWIHTSRATPYPQGNIRQYLVGLLKMKQHERLGKYQLPHPVSSNEQFAAQTTPNHHA
ncbi:MAG: glycosyltransferase [Chloroflexota bacterium]